MNRLTTEELKKIADMEDKALVEAFLKGIADVANRLVYLAAILQELAQRESDLLARVNDTCKLDVWVYLPLIASGQVSAVAVVAFWHRAKLMNLVASLPIDQQERLGLGETLEVEFFNPKFGQTGQPQFDSRKKLSVYLSEFEIEQVFDGKKRLIRDQAAQRAYLLASRMQNVTTKIRIPTLKVDPEHQLIYVDKKPVRVDAILDALAELAADNSDVAQKLKRLKPKAAKSHA